VKDDASQIAAFGDGAGPKYAYKHEFCIFAVREDARGIDGYPEDVMEYTEARWSDVDDQRTQHPTQKPVRLISDLVENSTSVGDTVLDPFMGSGTTAVAAIQNDRDYVGFEVDADNYQSVIERRISEAKRQMEANDN
jgi:DNA modification methylase